MKLIATLCTLAALAIATNGVEANVNCGLHGDVNGSGHVSAVDALLVLQLDAGLLDKVPCPEQSDTWPDGSFDVRDAQIILQYAAGIIADWPAP